MFHLASYHYGRRWERELLKSGERVSVILNGESAAAEPHNVDRDLAKETK